MSFRYRKERSERRVFALFHFVCMLFLYLYCVSIDFCATERILFCLNPPLPPRQFPKFQFSKKNKKKQKKKTIVPGLCLTPSSPHGLRRIGFFVFLVLLFFWNFGKLEFGKLEYWIFDVLGYFKMFNFLGSRQYSHFPSIPEQSLKSNDKKPQ